MPNAKDVNAAAKRSDLTKRDLLFMLLGILLQFKTVMIDAQTATDVYEKVLGKINPEGKGKFHEYPEWETWTSRQKRA